MGPIPFSTQEGEKMTTQEQIEYLKDYRPLLESLVPCGETVEAALEDKTSVAINAPRALMMCAFKAQVDLLTRLKHERNLRDGIQLSLDASDILDAMDDEEKIDIFLSDSAIEESFIAELKEMGRGDEITETKERELV